MPVSRALAPALLALLLMLPLKAEGLPGFEFVNQPVSDILSALSSWQGRSIVPDATVTGTSSFRFSGLDFEQALTVWLELEGLFIREKAGARIVSRLDISNDGTGHFDIRSSGAGLEHILSRLSAEAGIPIRYDTLPDQAMHVFITKTRCTEAVRLLMRPWPEWQTAEEGGALILSRNATGAPPRSIYDWGGSGMQESSHSSAPLLTRVGELYELSIRSAPLEKLIAELFSLSGNQYSLLMNPDTPIGALSFSDRNFDDALALILLQANARLIMKDGVAHIIPADEKDAAKVLGEGIEEWTEIRLQHLEGGQARSLLGERFPGIQLVGLEGSPVLLFRCPARLTQEVHEVLSLFDRPGGAQLVGLRYIRVEDLAKNPPPGFSSGDFRNTGTGNAFYFTGSEERLSALRAVLLQLDRPRPRIRYDLLIIQYQDTESLSRETKIQIHPLRLGDSSGLTAALDGLIGLRFDVLSLFGHHFSAQLHTAIKSNRAGVFADTSLFGLSGEELRFQNTATYRYREMAIDPDSGKPLVSGVTREILSGVVVRIQGWVSGDGMITMEVEASVSKRGADISGTSGNPPPTSEKMISTRIRAASGEPVILSGLRWSDSDLAEQRTPFISRIPLLGIPFRNFTRSKETGEMIIYLVPHLAAEASGADDEWLRALELLERCAEGVFK